MDLQLARSVAGGVVKALEPFCQRIEIAGSIRRQKVEDIKDVEIVAISKPRALVFGAPPVLPLVKRVEELRAEQQISYRYDRNGRRAAGEKYQRLLWGATPLDLFIVTPETWGVQLTLRTGDAEFSHCLVTSENFGGAMPDMMKIKDGRLWELSSPESDGEWSALPTFEEKDLFEALGLPWIVPHNRTEAVLRKILKGKTNA